MSNSDSRGRRSRGSRRSGELPADEADVYEEPNEVDIPDGNDHLEESAADDAPVRTRSGRKARSAARKGRGRSAATPSGARRRRSAAPAGSADPVSRFSASALRRVTVLGDRPTEVVYKLAEQSQRKRGAVALGTLLALCVVALVSLAGVLLFQLVTDGSLGTNRASTSIVEPPKGHSTLLPEVFQGKKDNDNDNDVFAPIAERAGDAEPFTEKRVFSKTEELELADMKLTLRDSEVTDSCTAFVWGDELAQTLADGSCMSAASGVYKDEDDEYVAQFVLFDMEDQDAAMAVNQALDPTDASTEPGFLLPRDTGIDGLHHGHSQATTQVMGHYLAVHWVARTDGGNPGEGTALAEVNVVAMNAAASVYEEVSDARKDDD